MKPNFAAVLVFLCFALCGLVSQSWSSTSSYKGLRALETKGCIVWEEVQKAVTLEEGVEYAFTSFVGTNNSSKELYIRSVEINCACLMVYVKNRKVMPGETVKVDLKYALRDAGGTLTHGIEVYSEEDGRTVLYNLIFTVTSPVRFLLPDRKHIWELGSMETKESKLLVPKNSGITLSSAQVFGFEPGLFSLEVIEDADDKNLIYVFRVTPSFPSSLKPKKGALGAIGLLLTDTKKREYKDLIQLINWPIPPP
jgi:hypothetical protein